MAIGKIAPQLPEKFYAEFGAAVSGAGTANQPSTVAQPPLTSAERSAIAADPGRPGPEPHDCAQTGCTVAECPPHRCTPRAIASIRQLHWIMSTALGAAIRWEWIRSVPADIAKKPKQRRTQPEPPSAVEAVAALVMPSCCLRTPGLCAIPSNLWRYAHRYAAAGFDGLSPLRTLTTTDKALRPDVALAALDVAAVSATWARRADAVAPTAEAVMLRREQAAPTPPTHRTWRWR